MCRLLLLSEHLLIVRHLFGTDVDSSHIHILLNSVPASNCDPAWIRRRVASPDNYCLPLNVLASGRVDVSILINDIVLRPSINVDWTLALSQSS